MNASASRSFSEFCEDIRLCTLCADHLPLGPKPVFRAHPDAKILVAGQAPGTKVHETGIPFNDPSGVRLREWMGIDESTFYDTKHIAIIPMGFCYPGRGKSGDLPPRPECAETWREDLLSRCPNIQLTLAIGQYAIAWHLQNQKYKTLTETVRHWKEFGPHVMPLPHPSPRNNIWLRKNPWFEKEVVAELKSKVRAILS